MFRIFSHSTPVHFSSWNCESGPKLRKSFIHHLCTVCLGPSCPTSKTDLTLECQTCQTFLMKEFEFERKPLCVLGILRPMNMETNWMFPTDISWPTHHAVGEVCSHLKLPGTDSLPLSGMLPTPQLFNTLHTFRHPCSVLNSAINFLIFNVSHLFTFNSCPLLLLKTGESGPKLRKSFIHSFVYSMPWALVSNI